MLWFLLDAVDRECVDIDQHYAFYRVDCKNPCQRHFLLFAVAVIPAFQPICEFVCKRVRIVQYQTYEILSVQVNDKTKFIY